jgi:DNA-binding response OmpR family regulator
MDMLNDFHSSHVVRNVLVVEDDRAVAHLISARLLRAGFATIFGDDVPDALRVLNAFRIDAVILDLGLPSGSGFDVIQRLKAFSRTGMVPILVVSGSADEQTERAARAAGADFFFSKPADLDRVLAALRTYYPAAAALDELAVSAH